MGILYNRLGRRADALKVVREIVREHPADAESWSLRGRLHKDSWLASWRAGAPAAEKRTLAASNKLSLGAAVKAYLRGFVEEPGSYYAGINALTLIHLLMSLSDRKRRKRSG